MSAVPFLDIAAGHAELRAEIDAAIARVIDGGWFIGGEEAEAFERDFAAYAEAGHCVGVGNGLDALTLALRAFGVGPGDEVIVPGHTFIATWLAVTGTGATPVPADIEPSHYGLDPAAAAKAITAKTKAIVPVDLYGHPADIEPIAALAREHGLAVIEDAAQAHGARYRGARVGAGADAACWSFYPGKNLGAMGDAGAVTTNNAEAAERIRRLGNYGSARKYEHLEKGVNSRLDPLQAAVLGVKLKHLDAWNARRAEIAALYRERLAGSGVTVPSAANWAEPVWHLFVIEDGDRDGLARDLGEAGVATQIHYPAPPHLQDAYRADFPGLSLPVSQAAARRVLSLPIGPHMSDGQVEQVAEAVLRLRPGG